MRGFFYSFMKKDFVGQTSFHFSSILTHTLVREKSVSKVSPRHSSVKLVISQGISTWNLYHQDTSACGILSVFWVRTEMNRLDKLISWFLFLCCFVRSDSIRVEILIEAASHWPWAGFDDGIELRRFKTGSCWYLRQKTHALAIWGVGLDRLQLLSPCVQFLLRKVGLYPCQSVCRPAKGLR